MLFNGMVLIRSDVKIRQLLKIIRGDRHMGIEIT